MGFQAKAKKAEKPSKTEEKEKTDTSGLVEVQDLAPEIRINLVRQRKRERAKSRAEAKEALESIEAQIPQAQREEAEKNKDSVWNKLKESLKSGIEWTKEKLREANNGFASLISILLDHLLEYMEEDEFGGKQTRQDVIKILGGDKKGEEKLKEKEKEGEIVQHKQNDVEAFRKVLRQGKTLEMDVHGGTTVEGKKALYVGHNKQKEGRVDRKFGTFIEVMKEFPNWDGKALLIDLKDKESFSLLMTLWDKIPENFKKAMEAQTFDPEVVLQVHRLDPEMPVSLHFLPLMRYKSQTDAVLAVQTVREHKSWVKTALTPLGLVQDSANDAIEAIDEVDMVTSSNDYKMRKRHDPKITYPILCFRDPLKEIDEIDSGIKKAVLDSGGYFTFYYDATYIRYVREHPELVNEKDGNKALSHIQINARDMDDLHDGLLTRVGRIVYDGNDLSSTFM